MTQKSYLIEILKRNITLTQPPKRYRKKPSALPATLVPHPGASVNPSYEDHQVSSFSMKKRHVPK